MSSNKTLLLFAITLTAFASCTILKNNDSEKNVRIFLTQFQNSLNGPDPEIAKFFTGGQVSDAARAAIKVLQNKETPFVTCRANFTNAVITEEAGAVRVNIPVVFVINDPESSTQTSDTLVLWLALKTDHYVITKVDGESFYETFSSARYETQWKDDARKDDEERAVVYEKIEKIKTLFDSVIWYTTYKEVNYFYVVKGAWINYFADGSKKGKINTGAKMGLVNEHGEIIIPIEYDLVGTIGFDRPNIVEVRNNGKWGHFDIKTKQLAIPATYDMIIPYTSDVIIVKQDSSYGWVGNDLVYHSGLADSTTLKWVHHFGYLKKNFSFDRGSYALCEIPLDQRSGYGILLPPSYLVANGIFGDIEGGIGNSRGPSWKEYIKTAPTILDKISAGVSALITSVTERYIGGREEFYEENRITFVNSQQDSLGVAVVEGGEVRVRQVDSTLIEVVARAGQEYYFGDADVDELPYHSYFLLRTDQSVMPLHSDRLFPQTKYVKMDSTYLLQKRMQYSPEQRAMVEVSEVTLKTWIYMRNEILNDYGYRFKPSDDAEVFTGGDYHPVHDSIEDFADEMTETDKHNLAFLDKIISLMNAKPV